MSAVVAEALGFRYPDKHQTDALKGISFRVDDGAMLALVGPNGGGKSTLLSLLSTARHAHTGRLSLLGYEIPRHEELARKNLATVFQSPALDGLLTAEENVWLAARLFRHDISKTDAMRALKSAGLEDLAQRRVHTLSGGQKRRVELAKVLLSQPALLLLDEPTVGLDPEAKAQFWQAIKSYRDQTSATVVVATHDDLEVSESTHLAFVVQGTLLHHSETRALLQQHADPEIHVTCEFTPTIETWLKEKGLTASTHEGGFQLAHPQAKEWLLQLLSFKEVSAASLRPAALSRVFAKLTGEQLTGRDR